MENQNVSFDHCNDKCHSYPEEKVFRFLNNACQLKIYNSKFCLLIEDQTPRWLIQLFVIILLIDLIHYILFFRDEGIGFNLIKVLVFGLPLAWIQSKQLLNQ